VKDTGTAAGSFNQKQLLARGWTLAAIARYLPAPDRNLRHSWTTEYRYGAASVMAAEAEGKHRIRKRRRFRETQGSCVEGEVMASVDAAELARCIRLYGTNAPHHTDQIHPDEPEEWMWRFWEYAQTTFRIKPPWRIEKLVFTTDDRKMHIFVEQNAKGVRFLCPRCGRARSQHARGRESIRVMRGAPGAIIHGQRPRIKCSRHGIVQIKLLAPAANQQADEFGIRGKNFRVWDHRDGYVCNVVSHL
jgi:hypothetical protein